MLLALGVTKTSPGTNSARANIASCQVWCQKQLFSSFSAVTTSCLQEVVTGSLLLLDSDIKLLFLLVIDLISLAYPADIPRDNSNQGAQNVDRCPRSNDLFRLFQIKGAGQGKTCG